MDYSIIWNKVILEFESYNDTKNGFLIDVQDNPSYHWSMYAKVVAAPKELRFCKSELDELNKIYPLHSRKTFDYQEAGVHISRRSMPWLIDEDLVKVGDRVMVPYQIQINFGDSPDLIVDLGDGKVGLIVDYEDLIMEANDLKNPRMLNGNIWVQPIRSEAKDSVFQQESQEITKAGTGIVEYIGQPVLDYFFPSPKLSQSIETGQQIFFRKTFSVEEEYPLHKTIGDDTLCGYCIKQSEILAFIQKK